MRSLALLLLCAASSSAAGFGADTAPLADAAGRARRLEQVRAVVLRHFAAEDREDMTAIRGTFAPDAAFEDVPRHEVFSGIENILKAYEVKDAVFPPVRRVFVRMMVDETGAYVEFDRVDAKTGEVYHRAAARFNVNEAGLITREVAYYDLARVLQLLAVHPTWLKRYLLAR